MRVSAEGPPVDRMLQLAFAGWLLGAAAYFLPAATWSPVSRFDLTRAVVEQGTLSIDAYADNTGDRARAHGKWYSDKAPFPALAAVPGYAAVHALQTARGALPEYRAYAGRNRPALRVTVNRAFQRGLYVCSIGVAGLSLVALGLLLWRYLRRHVSEGTALAGGAIATLATPAFPYATSFYGHVPAAAGFTAGILLLARASVRPRWTAAAAGACLGFAVGCEYITVFPLSVALLTYLVGSGWQGVPSRSRSLLWVVLGGLLPAALLGAYHHACYGAPWRTGYSFITDATFAAGHEQGMLGIGWPRWEALWGLTFGGRRGLFFIAPVCLPLVVGLVAEARARLVARCALAALLTLLLLNAGYYMWWGGAAAGPRHLIPALPLIALGIPWLRQRRWWWRATWGLAAVSVANMMLIAAVGIEAPSDGNVLLDFVYPRFLDGRIAGLSGASNMGLELGWVRGGSLGPFMAWVLLGAHLLHRQLLSSAELLAAPPSSEAAYGTLPRRAPGVDGA